MMRPSRSSIFCFTLCAALAACIATGCVRGPIFVAPDARKAIDRQLVDYPGRMVLREVVHNLTAPIDMEEDADGNIIVAESGSGGFDPRLYGFKLDGTYFSIYPIGVKIPNVAPLNLVKTGWRMYGPIGGILIDNNKIYVTHRDKDGNGVVTAFTYDGNHSTVAGPLPAQGDNGMSDIVLGPTGRLWFAVGAATNSGVVGLDNWQWIKKYPEFSDRSYVDLKLNGFHFKSKNPDAGILGGPEIAVTAPYQPFNVSTQTRIRRSEHPTGAIYSADPNGGSLRVEAHGIRAPRGLAFSKFFTLYMTANGMELRGTRPIKDDPDALLKVVSGAWYGFPDYSTDLMPITDQRFQPPPEMAIKSGYPEVSFLLDHNASNNGEGLIRPAQSTLLQKTFPSLSGAANFEFVPETGPLAQYSGNAIIPLSGDHAPFANSGKKLLEPVGFKVVRFDPATRDVNDFIRNTRGGPASKLPEGQGLLERPTAVKFARDGSLYILDFGVATMRPDGRLKVKPQTGRLLKLEPLEGATTQPASREPSHPTSQ